MSKEFIEDEDLAIFVRNVIDEFKMDHLIGVDIKSVLVAPEISKTVPAKIVKCSPELNFFGKFDYLIEISYDLWNTLKDEQTKKLLVYHQLLHILIKTDKKGNTKYKLAKHNYSEFSQIVDKYGTDWWLNLKTIISSMYDFENGEQDNIKS